MTDKKNKENLNLGLEVVQWLIALLIFFVLIFFSRTFVLEEAEVKGDSMLDNLASGQVVIIYKAGYFFHPPAAGDIVAIKIHNKDQTDYIKRVIAVAGDRIDIINGCVYKNGLKLNEPYIKGKTFAGKAVAFPVTVPAGKLFCLGDNREHSNDSRAMGFFDISDIAGKAVFRIRPFAKIGFID